ncbi:hypothetical protein MRB53_040739 [Persea americana]|nr:hypothetical protein MRB53_040739 [Persea americana]
MEDLEIPAGSPVEDGGNEPQGNADPRDPLRPEIDEEDNAGTPPIADPHADMETRADEQNGEPDDHGADDDAADDDDDLESELEELDEKEFEDFDASALNLPDQPKMVDESNVALLGVHKRKRTAEEEAERERKKKKKDKKRDKPKRSKKGAIDDDFTGGDGGRARKSNIGPSGKTGRRGRSPENEDQLTPDERRRRALDRKMDEALKTNRVSRRKATQDMEERADAEIETMRQRMAKACELDAEARARGDIATHKLKVLPAVVELMNRNTIQSQLVDPDINLLEAVRFMLEPADQDAALPNYQIQRELFTILGRLNIGKEALIASGLGKVVLFYTKSIQPQPEIKRQAERLLGEWMRVILGKSKDHRSKPIQTKTFDPLLSMASQRPLGSQMDKAAAAAEKRRRVLAQPGPTNRARVEGGVGTYTIAPVSNLSNALNVNSRKLGASGEDAFRKIAARSAMKTGGPGARK